MTNTADCTKTHVEDNGRHHSRLEGYLERLEDKSVIATRPSTTSWWHR
jgi:hypothetical protein